MLKDRLTALLKKSNAVCMLWSVISRYGIVNEAELRVLKYLVKENDIVFDIGANIGSYTYALSCLTKKGGKVIAVEPLPDNLVKLRFLKKYLRLDNVFIESKAVSNEIGKVMLTVPIVNKIVKNTRGYINFESTKGDSKSLEVKATTIPELIKKYNLQRLDFIKCDVEGAEKLVFSGGECIVKKMKPNLICEISGGYGMTANDVFNYIKNICNYNVYVCNGKKFIRVNCIEKSHNNYIFTMNQL